MIDNTKIERQLQLILKQQRQMQESIDRIDRDLSEDRKDIGDLKISNGNIINQMEEIRNLFNKQTTKIGDKIAEVAQPIMDSAEDLRECITEKKVIALDKEKAKNTIKKWFQFWKR